jgi:hypothetical protein
VLHFSQNKSKRAKFVLGILKKKGVKLDAAYQSLVIPNSSGNTLVSYGQVIRDFKIRSEKAIAESILVMTSLNLEHDEIKDRNGSDLIVEHELTSRTH